MSTTAATAGALARKKVTTLSLAQKKERGEKISILTAYDYPTALALDSAGVDAILVGDSLGMVVLGYENTLPVTMEDMLHHAKAVARGAKNALLIGDLPFLSYQVSVPEAVANAGRFLQQGGMDAVKLEGGQERAETVAAIVRAGIPVMGHLGLTPQAIHQLGGFRAQAKTAQAARRLLQDALALQEAGCFAIVLEAIPAQLAGYLTQRLAVPTIGIGAGAQTDGQVLVTQDLLGIFQRFTPKFAKQYANLHREMDKAFSTYIAEVQTGQFPAPEHSLSMPPEEWEALLEAE